MSHFPTPRTCSPQTGSFVVFSLDPISMVKDLCIPSLTHACQRLGTGKYVAYIGQLDQAVPSSTHVSTELHFVFQETPPNKFDWVSPALLDSVPAYSVTPVEEERVRALMNVDVKKWNRDRSGRGGVQPRLRRSPRRRLEPIIWSEMATPLARNHAESQHFIDDDDDESFHTAYTSPKDDDEDVLEYLYSSAQRFAQSADALRSMATSIGRHKSTLEPIITISYDLSSVTNLLPPQQYFQEWNDLQNLIQRFKLKDLKLKSELCQMPQRIPPNKKSWFIRALFSWQGKRKFSGSSPHFVSGRRV
ncbi:hypothetical protein BDP27DRAFT_1327487 [Rhodocollybia butyracea]|uniref:Uncharacterized protein n=1 Tax=Rhodocollybia butyracea TaxID=206335 RepID=A0A9P5U706_9AGAR|nr:hypothetical protein BDP27DRAFT_1327487 [Rhodocollybia butyracea]